MVGLFLAEHCDSAEGWSDWLAQELLTNGEPTSSFFLSSPLYQRLYIHVVFWDMLDTLSVVVSRGYIIWN